MLDPTVTDFIKKLICSGCRRVKELESQAMDFVTVVLFEGACSPDRCRGRFTLNDAKLEISLLMLKWSLDFLKWITKMFSILYRHVEKQCRKMCQITIPIYVPFNLLVQLI